MAVLRQVGPPTETEYFPLARRVRGFRQDLCLVDSADPWLVWGGPGPPFPRYAFPQADVRAELVPDSALEHWEDPDLAGRVGIAWHAADRWFEEDEEVFVHARDPFKRIDTRASGRHVVVELDGTVLADSRRPLLLYEPGLPTRSYLPREDVRLEAMQGSETVTRCPYKGTTRHWAIDGTDVAWSYEDPLPEIRQIAGLICFYNERVDVIVDGERPERPRSEFS